jgi:hypothetical protein
LPFWRLSFPAPEKDALHPGRSLLIEDRSRKVMNAAWCWRRAARAVTFPVRVSKAAKRCKGTSARGERWNAHEAVAADSSSRQDRERTRAPARSRAGRRLNQQLHLRGLPLTPRHGLRESHRRERQGVSWWEWKLRRIVCGRNALDKPICSQVARQFGALPTSERERPTRSGRSHANFTTCKAIF